MIFLLSVFLAVPHPAFGFWIGAGGPGLADTAEPFALVQVFSLEMGGPWRSGRKVLYRKRKAGGFQWRCQRTFKFIALHDGFVRISRISAGQGIAAARTKAVVSLFLRDRSGDRCLSSRGGRTLHLDLLSAESTST